MASTAKVKYSELEQRLLNLVPRNGDKISTPDLIAKFYGRSVPFNGRAIIGGMMRTIIRKSLHNKEPWKILKTPRSGPKPISYWIMI